MYSSNQYNYATPQTSATSLTGDIFNAQNVKYFTLFDNNLGGSYVPVVGDVGLWGTSLSDNNGVLNEPLVVTVEGTKYINAFRLVGSESNFPVSFTVDFYKNGVFVLQLSITDNTNPEYIRYLPQTYEVDKYVVTVYKISAINSVARLHNAYNPGYIKRTDALNIGYTENNISSEKVSLHRSDICPIRLAEASYIHNTIDRTYDEVNISCNAAAQLYNIHSVMKAPERNIQGKVYITYTDPMLEYSTQITTSQSAYNSRSDQVIDSDNAIDYAYFTLYDNDLTGAYYPIGEHDQVGWASAELSNAAGSFTVPPYVEITFEARPISTLSIMFDTVRNNIARDFNVLVSDKSGNTVAHTIRDNTDSVVELLENPLVDVVKIRVEVLRINKAFYPATIVEIPAQSTILYKGYDDVSELMSIDLLEELTYEDEVEALGGVSANEITVVLDNSNKEFFFNSGSPVAKQLRRNRKIVPWLGAEVIPGQIEWHTLGTFWSYKWDVPVNGLTATVVGFDTIGLLGLTDFIAHHTQKDASIGDLLKYVLDDASKQLNFIQYDIDEALFDIIIPYAWFDRASHAEALRKISKCYPMHIYCDRQGIICAKPQKLHLDYFYDEWSDDTNVIDKNYSSLYTVLPNLVNITVNNTGLNETVELVRDETVFSVEDTVNITLLFTSPYYSDLSVEVVCDEGISYTYNVYSWGIQISFVGTGMVHSIVCFGTAVAVLNQSNIERRNAESIRTDGTIVRNVSSDFIQTDSLAQAIMDRIFSLSEYDKYDASVNYRGDIALTINDPILLHDGIAPDNRYNIKRHELSWNGALTGSADLNT